MSKFTTIGQRVIFENASDLIRGYGYDPASAILTQSFLRAEAAMSVNTSQYNLPLVVTQNNGATQFSTERRLQLTDVFVVSSIAVYAAKPASANDALFKLYNYGAPSVFSSANCAESVDGVFANGFLSMMIDNKQVLPAWDLDQHYRAPVTQANSVLYYTGATALKIADSRDGSNDGIMQVEPNIVLAGNFNIQFTLNTNVGMTAVEASSRWVVRLRGILAQNFSKIAS